MQTSLARIIHQPEKLAKEGTLGLRMILRACLKSLRRLVRWVDERKNLSKRPARRGMGVDQRVDPSREKRWTTAYPLYAGRAQCHLLCDQRRDSMAHVAHQFPQVAERLSLLARLETPGGVGQHPRYVTRTRPSKRGEAQTSHGGVSR